MQVQSETQKVMVNESALFRRLDRKIYRESGIRLRKCSYDSRWFNTVGRYFTVEGNWVRDTDIDLEAWGREDGVLKAWEAVIGEN